MLQAYRIFDVSSKRAAPAAEEDIQRLAQLTGTSGKAMRRGFDTVEPLVRAEADSSKLTCAPAWQRVVSRLIVTKAGKRLLGRPLHKAVVRWRGYRASTSGNEHAFTLTRGKITNHQGAASAAYDEAMAKVLIDGNRDDPDTVALKARESWVAYGFGRPRCSGAALRSERVDKGVPRLKRRCRDMTETGFLRKRRQYPPNMQLLPLPDACDAIDSMKVQSWSVAHDEELEFTENKLKKRKVQAFAENVINANEITDDLAFLADATRQKRDAAEVARKNVNNRHRNSAFGGAVSLPNKTFLRGKCVYVDNCNAPLVKRASMVRTMLPWEADIQIVDNPEVLQAKSRRMWCAALRGCFVLTPSAVEGVTGAAIKYHAAIAVRRFIWISRAFMTAHADIANAITNCIAAGPCSWPGWPTVCQKWTLLDGMDAFIARKRKDKGAATVALVSSSELSGQEHNESQR